MRGIEDRKKEMAKGDLSEQEKVR